MTERGHAWAAEILARCEALAQISESPEHLTRTYLTPEHARANALVRQWMEEAGMTAHVDPVGNVVGRYPGDDDGAPALMLGSHLDTVRNAGKYDGILGVLTAIACVGRLARERRQPAFPLVVVGFANEEGTRFGATLTGSRAIAGRLDPAQLDACDASGVSLAGGLKAFGLDPARVREAAFAPERLAAFVELHIEQGPVLEQHGLALGVVTAISGATRLSVEMAGLAGHAGTVPMGRRQDALAAAAEAIGYIERRCSGRPGLVGTVGMIEAKPGAINVIPGHARFTIDVRAERDDMRSEALADIRAELQAICSRRRIELDLMQLHENPSTPCSPAIMDQLERAIAKLGFPTMRLPSGAGHDAMVLKEVTEVGMIFLRCTAGISHNPVEAVTAEDVEAGARVLHRFIETFIPPR